MTSKKKQKQKKQKSTFTFGGVNYQNNSAKNVPSLNSKKDNCSAISFELKAEKEQSIKNVDAVKCQEVPRFKIVYQNLRKQSETTGFKLRREAVQGIKTLSTDEKEINQLVIETYTAGNRTTTETGLNTARIRGKEKKYRCSKGLVNRSTQEQAKTNFKRAMKKVKHNV